MLLLYAQSPTQWPPLTSRIDLCQCLTVLQDSCKTHLCSRFCFLDDILRFVYIFSWDIKFNINIWGENTVVYLFKVICSMYSSDRMKTLIRIFKNYDKNIVFMDCQIHLFKYLFEKKGNPFDFLRSFCWKACYTSTVIALLLRH